MNVLNVAQLQDMQEDEARRVKLARELARMAGNELLTPRAARELFGKAEQTVRQAVRLGHVYAPFDLSFADKKVRLISLKSAREYWGRGDDFDFDERLDQWREEAHLIHVGGQPWTVLHPTELVTVSYPMGEME